MKVKRNALWKSWLEILMPSVSFKTEIEHRRDELVMLFHNPFVVFYKAFLWNEDVQQYTDTSLLTLRFHITDRDNGASIRDQVVPSHGKIAFTATDSGYYTICIRSAYNSGQVDAKAKIKLEFDIVLLGKGAADFANKQQRLSEINQHIQQLVGKIQDLRREQEYLKILESEFRSSSEKLNAKVVWWSMLQVVVLAATAYWQSHHLKAFFKAQKLL
jgi:p24 family protein alpha